MFFPFNYQFVYLKKRLDGRRGRRNLKKRGEFYPKFE
jgi:hypothetical protein